MYNTKALIVNTYFFPGRSFISYIFVLPAIFKMNIKPFIFSLAFLSIGGQNSFAQAKYSKLSVDRKMKDTFSFSKQWDYSWEVFKDDSTSEFTRNDDSH